VVLFKAGVHVPLMAGLLVELVGSADKVAPAQMGDTCVKVGTIFGFTTMVMVAVVAHCPALGVNVYVVVVVLFKLGFHVPLTLLVEVVGNADKVAPEQIGGTCVNVGVTFGFTTIVIVAVVAHWPAVGVNVYVVVVVLFKLGFQVPVILLFDVVGSAANMAPEQIGDTCVNVGVTFGFTTMVIVAVVAHCPAVGVNVYVVVVVLFSVGFQVPLMLLIDVVGSADKLAPEHIGATCVNVGVTFGFTTMVIVAVVAHCPAVGVNV